MKIIENIFKPLLLAITALFLIAGIESYANHSVRFVGSDKNDLYTLLKMNGLKVERFDNLSDALTTIRRGEGLFVVADKYPDHRAEISAEQYKLIDNKKVRLFVEYPAYLPEHSLLSESYHGSLERGVVSSDFFGAKLPAMSILGINDCTIIPMKVSKPLISYAKIAGFDKAQFGLTNTKAYPLLFIDNNRMVTSTSLSIFKRARFGPSDSWKQVWQQIIGWVVNDRNFQLAQISVDPTPAYSADETLKSDARRIAVENGTKWLDNARLFIHPSWEHSAMQKYQPKNGNPNLFFGPPINKDMLVGDGSIGVMEGHASNIYNDGTQQYRYFIRADVQGETAFLLASAADLNGKKEHAVKAEKLLDYLFYTSEFRGGARGQRDSASYGLISWANTHLGTFFNDDNARCILGAIGASAKMDNQRWNSFIVENILGNLRTCSKQGFQGNAMEQSQIEKNGWQYYNNRDFTNPHPHFESWMWACYLWLYDKTGYQPLLDKAKAGIEFTMNAYPDGWLSQNGIQQERARMILPLAWLVRIEDTPQHRQWLDTIVSKLLESQQPSGAIREELGNSSSDKNKILVTSNDAYGKNEAPLIAVNGDPVSDMLYTCNFSFFALNEAAHATGNPKYKQAVDSLADFLVRIQVKSNDHTDIDGAWFRAFDYGRWDYWASNADNGWGAWSTLTGWIQSWIVATEAMVEKNESYWDVTKKLDVKHNMQQSLWMMQE